MFGAIFGHPKMYAFCLYNGFLPLTPHSSILVLCLYVVFALDVGFVTYVDIVVMFLYIVSLILGSHGNTHVEQCSSPKGS